MSNKRKPKQTSPIRQWLDDNKPLINFVAVWLLFGLEIAVAKFFGDYHSPPYYIRKFMDDRFIFIFLITTPLGLLSLINVYAIPAFVKWFYSNKPKPAFIRLPIVVALFSSIFWAPLIGIGVSITFALFLALTIIHTSVRIFSGVR